MDLEASTGREAAEAAVKDRGWSPLEDNVLRTPMPLLKGDFATQAFVRGALWSHRRRIKVISGLEHIAAEMDPFIVAANHSQRYEAVVLPGMLFYHRHGKRVHFLADWPMMLIPGVGLMYRCAQVIPVFGKSARPAFLNSLRRFYEKPGTAWERAGQILEQGGSVGAFPEGTVNRNPHRLLRGRLGAAQLAVDHGVPVVPIGIRFPHLGGAKRIPDGAAMEVEIGAPLHPPETDAESGTESKELVRGFQARIMERLAELSGKSWSSGAPRRRVDGS